MEFSIVFASRDRIGLLSNLIDSISKTTADLSRIEVLVGIDDDDFATIKTSSLLESKYSFVKFYVRPRSNMLNRDYLNWLSANWSKGRFIIVCNDDTEFKTHSWDEIILDRMQDYLADKPDGIAYGYISDSLLNRNGMQYCCFPLVTRQGFNALGFAMPPEYPAWEADIGLWRIYSSVGRICNLSEVLIDHISYHAGKRGQDEINHHVRRISGHGGAPIQRYSDTLRSAMNISTRSISVLLATSRLDRLTKLIESGTFHYEWEFIIVTPPMSLPPQWVGCDRINHIIDSGNPVRALSIAASHAKGIYITFVDGDCSFIPGAVDRAISSLNRTLNHRKAVWGEGINGPPTKLNDFHRSNHINDSWWFLNSMIMHRRYYNELGGLDCSFEDPKYALADLSARMQLDGSVIEAFPGKFMDLTSVREESPMFKIKEMDDKPTYDNIYQNLECSNRTKIEPDSWKSSPVNWDKRIKVS